MGKLITLFPTWMRPPLRSFALRFRHRLRAAYYYGHQRYCPVCENPSRLFGTYGLTSRSDARCFHCGSLERHRLVWMFFRKQTNLFEHGGLRMLHVAPERCFVPPLQAALQDGYVTADLYMPDVKVRMDITDISYPDDYFDAIYCSHVLQCVEDDRKAMRELCRVLKPDGWAILLTAVYSEMTREGPESNGPLLHPRGLGRGDYLRRYGPDFVDRLTEAGFSVRVWNARDFIANSDICRMGIAPAAGRIYFCTTK